MGEGRKAMAAGDIDGALVHYRELKTEYPESEEAMAVDAEVAAGLVGAASDKAVSDPDLAIEWVVLAYSEWGGAAPRDALEDLGDALWSAAAVKEAEGGPMAAARLLDKVGDAELPAPVGEVIQRRVRELPDDSPLPPTLLWVGAEDRSLDERSRQAMALIEMRPSFQAVIQDWLDAHLFAGASDACLTPLRSLSDIDDLSELEAVKEACEEMLALAPGADEVATVRASLEAVPAREAEIKASPAYKLEHAFSVCREYVTFVRGARSRMRSLARSGDQGAFYRYKDKVDRDLARWQDRLMPQFDYLRRRMDALSDFGARARLAQRTQRECEP